MTETVLKEIKQKKRRYLYKIWKDKRKLHDTVCEAILKNIIVTKSIKEQTLLTA